MSDVVRRRTKATISIATISISREPIETRDFEMARATRAIDGTHCDAREPHDECPMIGLSRDGTRPTRAGGDGAATRRHTATDERASERTASEATRTRARNERTMARRAGDATGKKNDDGDARRGRCARGRRATKRATIAAMGVMSACGVGANALTHISTLAGSYKLNTLNTTTESVNGGNAHTSIENALDYGNSVAHIIAELRTLHVTSSAADWDKMGTNYDSMSKTWVEDAVANYATTSNEWTWISTKDLRGINNVSTSATPLEAYIAEAVVIAKADTAGTRLEAMREIIEKTVWDAVGYQGSLLALAAAQEDVGAGSLCTGSSQNDAMKAHWDVGAALLIGDGYHSVLGRAQKRGLEFGTMGAAGISKPYETIVKLLRDGQEIEGATMCADLHNIYEDIEAQMRVVYAQSILKYAYKIDKKLASGASVNAYDDIVAEGQAMYRVIAGDMLRKCPSGTACSGAVGHFNTFFDITVPKQRGTWDYGNYCTARKHVVDFINEMSDHGVKEASLGTYSDAAYVNCALETNEDPARELKSLAGSYFTSELTHSSTAQATVSAKTQYAKALGLSKNVAHIVAEMDTFIRNEDVSASWDDMSSDFVEAYKAWTETAPYTSNEWNPRMTQYEFTKVAVGSSGKHAATGTPLSGYIAEAVTLAKADKKYHEAAKEMIEKTMLDAVGFHAALNHLSYAQSSTVCVNNQKSADQEAAWDVAAALLIGDGYHSVMGRAQKRGVEFGTMGTAHTAKPYETILKLLRSGQEQKDCTDLHNIYEGIERQLRIVYSQCVIKYAFKIDTALKSGAVAAYGDDQAEGQALYRVIAGDVKAKGTSTFSNAYQFFDALFDVRTAPARGTWAYDNYCTAIANLKGVFGFTDSELGQYHEAYHVHCDIKTEFSSTSYADLVAHVHGLSSGGVSTKEIRAAEALAAFSFIVALAGVIVGSIALHKSRKSGATAFKSSYVVHNV